MPKNPHEKAIQRALMQYKNPANRELVLEGLRMTGRTDLIGYGPKCLIRPIRENHGNTGKRKETTVGGKKHGCNNRKKSTIRNTHKKSSGGGRR